MTAIPEVIGLHLGKMHPYEHALVYLLAFGPVLLLVAVIRISRRRDELEHRDEAQG